MPASSSATSTAAACSPTCYGTVGCCRPTCGRRSAASSSTGSAATRPCSATGSASSRPRCGVPDPRACCRCSTGSWLDGEDSRRASSAPDPVGRPGAGRPARRGGRPPPPAVELHRPRRARPRARRVGPLRGRRRVELGRPTWSCCPARRRPCATWPGCAAQGIDRAIAGQRRRRRSASAAATRCSATASPTTSSPAPATVDRPRLAARRDDRRSAATRSCASTTAPRGRAATRSTTAGCRARPGGGWVPLDDGGRGHGPRPTAAVRGTTLHGLFEHDGFRAGVPRRAGRAAGASASCPPASRFAAARDRPLRPHRRRHRGPPRPRRPDCDLISQARLITRTGRARRGRR